MEFEEQQNENRPISKCVLAVGVNKKTRCYAKIFVSQLARLQIRRHAKMVGFSVATYYICKACNSFFFRQISY